jgi:hypothetical protein
LSILGEKRIRKTFCKFSFLLSSLLNLGPPRVRRE